MVVASHASFVISLSFVIGTMFMWLCPFAFKPYYPLLGLLILRLLQVQL